MLRPLRVPPVEAVSPNVVGVHVGLCVEASLGYGVPVVRHVGEGEGLEESLRKHLRVLDPVRNGLEVDVQSRRLGPVRRCAPTVDESVGAGIGEGQRVARDDLRRQLSVQQLARLPAPNRFGVRQKERLTEKGVAGASSPEPDVVLPEGATDLEAVIPLRGAGIEPSPGAGDRVRAALGHKIYGDAGGRERGVGAAGSHADAVERIEIEEGGRETAERDTRAFEVHDALIAVCTLADESRRRRRSGAAAEIHVRQQDSRNLPHDGRWIAGRGDLSQFLLVEGCAGFDLTPVEKRRRPEHREGFRGPRDAQSDSGDDVAAGLDRDFLSDGLEAGA